MTRWLVPLYEYPPISDEVESGWHRTVDAAPVGSVFVANPASGPGTAADPVWSRIIDYALLAGHTVIGYVPVGWGNRPTADVLADVDTWARLYPAVGGVFADEAPVDVADGLSMLRVRVRARAVGWSVVANPGVPTPWLAEVADVVVAFEGDATALAGWAAPAGCPHRVGVLVHGAGPDDVTRLVGVPAGWVFASPRALADGPWNAAPPGPFLRRLAYVCGVSA